MARTARTHSDSGVYHVILRGVNKQQIFECTSDLSPDPYFFTGIPNYTEH